MKTTNLNELLVLKCNELMAQYKNLDLCLALIANNPKELTEIRILDSSTLSNSKF